MYVVRCANCDAPTLDHIVTRERAESFAEMHAQAAGCPMTATEVEEQ